jgi:alkanesulfonate monooxygenase SsuD/methylene tetrahydromethanopterin reductase-like flavin-dependent oxidoreductase (luciferase family)
MLRPVGDFALQVHWSSAPCALQPELDDFLRLARLAERCGLDSVHVPLYASPPQALEWAVSAAAETARVSFRVGTDFTCILQNLRGKALLQAARALPGRLILHILFSENEEPLNAAKEFAANLQALFPGADVPRFDVEGQSAEAAFLAIQRGDCLWRLPDVPDQVYADALPILHFGKHVGMTAYVIARENYDQAHDVALDLLPGACAEHWQDSKAWRGPHIWSSEGIAGRGTAAIVGSYDEVADVLQGFKTCGITQVLLRELRWGHEFDRFTEEVLPRLRSRESKQKAA